MRTKTTDFDKRANRKDVCPAAIESPQQKLGR